MTILLVLGGLALVGVVLLVRDVRNLRSESAKKDAALVEELKAVRQTVASASQRLPGLEALVSNARREVQAVSDGQGAAMKEIRAFGEFLDHAIEELRKERKEREAPDPEGWKAGEAALSRMARVRQNFAELEEKSFNEMLRGETK